MNKYSKGEIIEGYVTGIENYGIFVTLDEYYSGLIHISEISNGFVRDIKKFVNIGETIRVRIISINDETFHAKLSIKDLDYRIVNKRKGMINETEHGFTTLQNNLENWINEMEK